MHTHIHIFYNILENYVYNPKLSESDVHIWYLELREEINIYIS